MRIVRTVASAVIVVLAGSAPAFAQARHVVDPGAITATVVDSARQQDADRAAVREALTRPEVRRVAKSIGVNVDEIAPSIATLSGADLERAATAARQVNDSMAGGASSVVISTTTIIIILLVIILLIVALK
jgi:hypothetical protein